MQKSHVLRLAAAAVAVLAALAFTAAATAGHGHNVVAKVLVEDDCEPHSFNAAIGPGTCVGHGHTTFEEFIGQLISMQDAPAWRFDPSELSLQAGDRIRAVNVGGEFHTFTEVAEFGGGCVEELNAILGLTPVPECEVPGIFDETGLAPGQKLKTAALAAGVHLYECLVHPWMRTTANVG
jgi:plastocyanin